MHQPLPELRDVPGYSSYKVTRDGRVYTDFYKRFLVPSVKDDGYHCYHCSVNGKLQRLYAHRAVALAYIPNDDPAKTLVNHKDGNPSNNNVENLEWCTKSENVKHAMETGLLIHKKHTVCKLDANGEILEEFDGVEAAAKSIDLAPGFVASVCRGKKLTAGGFRWVYKENMNKKPREHKLKKKVFQLSADGEIIATYDEVKDVAEKYKCSKKQVRYAIENNTVLFDCMWGYIEKEKEPVKEDPTIDWLPVPGYPKYKISRDGQVYSGTYKRLMKPQPQNGYLSVKLTGKSLLIHRLVALTYIPNPDNKDFVNHKDGNPINNAVENLEWCTHAENMRHAYDTGLNPGRQS